MKIIATLCLCLMTACSSTERQQAAQNLFKDALAAGEGYLVAGQAGAIAYGTRQEVKNLRQWTSAKEPKNVNP